MRSSWIKATLVILVALLAVGSILYNQILIDEIMERERSGIDLWAKAIEFTGQQLHQEISGELLDAASILRTIEEVPDSVIRKIEFAESARSSQEFVSDNLVINPPFSVPIIMVDESGFIIQYRFIEEEDLYDGIVEDFAYINDPVMITFGEGDQMQRQYIYFGESQTVQFLRYFPYFQFGFLAVLIGIAFMAYQSINRSEKSNLWVGMAKEAAHQLGTPLSSLYGWIQLLKDQNRESSEALSIVYEVENDVGRIKSVAERFNKIGSKPELQNMKLNPIIDQVYDYMERRIPQFQKSVELKKSVQTSRSVNLNPELFQWAIENLIKNAMDAIKDTQEGAFISLDVSDQGDQIIIDVEDSGIGIDRKNLNEIFKPGYSTKKRGWGLGLSLTRRIIEEYHDGKIFVLRSESGRGTVIRIILPV